MTRIPAITLGGSVVVLSLWYGGLAGLAYLAFYALTLLPGLPVGWRLFGRQTPAGWVAGAIIGYALSALAFWVPMYAGVPGPAAFAAAYVVLAAGVWGLVRRGGDPLLTLPPWTRRDTATWLLLLHLVLALLAWPFGRVGEQDRSGTKYYRAYFTADFVWHAALTQELARYDQPPINPYLAPEPIHYYWTYFLVPAAIAGPEDARLIDIEAALLINATGTALLLFSMVFLVAWGACGRTGPAALASVIALLAPSLEGTYEILRLLRAGAPLDALRETNIDAVTAWPPFRGLRVDGLVRSMWWTPQHAMSLALGLIGVLAATRLPSRETPDAPALNNRPARTTGSALFAGVALGLSATMNPFLGAVFCVVYGVTAVVDAIARRKVVSGLLAHWPALVPVAAALAWASLNRMSEGAGGALSFGWLHLARNSPVATFLLSFGGLLPLVLLGLVPWRTLRWSHSGPGIIAAAAGIGLMYFVSLVDRAWVGFRAGNILLTTLPILAARGIAGMIDSGRARFVAVLALLCGLAGASTTLIDVYNAQDISNLRMGPGFLWTIPITPAQQAGLQWLRSATPPDAIVQADPIVRGRQNWSVIPSFAGRRMAAGLPISLLETPEYRRRSDRVHELMTAMTPGDAHTAARDLGIDYLWLDQDDAPAAAETMTRFASRPDLFTAVFRRGPVVVYRVLDPNR